MLKPICRVLKRTRDHLLAFLLPPTGRHREIIPPGRLPLPMAPAHTVTGLALVVRNDEPPGAGDAFGVGLQHIGQRPAPSWPAPFIRPYLVAYEQERLREAMAS